VSRLSTAWIEKRNVMVLLGIVLLIIGLFTVKALFWLGVVLLVAGLILNFAPGPWVGTAGSRRRYW
jgi:hypothetical protein